MISITSFAQEGFSEKFRSHNDILPEKYYKIKNYSVSINSGKLEVRDVSNELVQIFEFENTYEIDDVVVDTLGKCVAVSFSGKVNSFDSFTIVIVGKQLSKYKTYTDNYQMLDLHSVSRSGRYLLCWAAFESKKDQTTDTRFIFSKYDCLNQEFSKIDIDDWPEYKSK